MSRIGPRGAAKCQYRPADAALAPVFRTVFSVRSAPLSASSQSTSRQACAAIVADSSPGRGRPGVSEILCRYVPLCPPLKCHYRPPGPAPRAVFGTVFTVRLAPLSASSQTNTGSHCSLVCCDSGDDKKMLSGVRENRELLSRSRYRTVGEMVVRDEKFVGRYVRCCVSQAVQRCQASSAASAT